MGSGVREPTIFHRGLAEAFGVTHEQMEAMSLREIAERAFALGGTVEFHIDGGVGPGLTLTSGEPSVPGPGSQEGQL